MAPRRDVSEERKAQIIAAATQVFSRKGFSEARMEDIAEETGLSKGTLYLYFNSKDELITAILDLIFQREFKHLEQLEAVEISARQAVGEITDLIVNDFARMFHLMPITYEFLALAFRNQAVQQALQGYFDRYMDLLVPIIQQGMNRGEFKTGDAREVAVTFGAIVEGTFLLWVYDKARIDPEHNIRAGIQQLMEGIQVAT